MERALTTEDVEDVEDTEDAVRWRPAFGKDRIKGRLRCEGEPQQ